MQLAFIGLGRMGTPMAANLLEAGHTVTVYNRNAEKTQALAQLGAAVADHVHQTCSAEAVLSMLSNDQAVRDVTFGPDGLLAHLPAGAIHVSMSTISIELSAQLTQAHRNAGQHFVAAPVFGRPDAAAAAKLAIVVAGLPEIIERLQPVFAAFGQVILPVSERPRDANLVKICGNFMIASALEALGEAVALARKAGIAPQTFVDVMTSTLFNAPVYRTYGRLIAQEEYSPAGFAAPLGYKDVGLALEAATALQVPMPLASMVSDRLLRLLTQGGESLDWSAIGGLIATDAGLARPASFPDQP